MNDDAESSSPGTVTRHIAALRSSDPRRREDAAREIWQQYVPRLLELARQNLSTRVRRREDEHDALQETYRSFFRRQERGNFDLIGRNELWQLLVSITLCKVRNISKRNRRQRRDYRREASASASESDDSLPPGWILEAMEAGAPTPDVATALNEEFEARLLTLDLPLQQIALWKLEGWTHDEIALKLGCSKRTVIRKVELIRAEWENG